jgi:hypothetical protein
MADKLVGMIWEVTLPADAPRELLHSNILSQVLAQYEDDGFPVVKRYSVLCLKELKARRNIFPALYIIRSVWAQCPRDRKVSTAAPLPVLLPVCLPDADWDYSGGPQHVERNPGRSLQQQQHSCFCPPTRRRDHILPAALVGNATWEGICWRSPV